MGTPNTTMFTTVMPVMLFPKLPNHQGGLMAEDAAPGWSFYSTRIPDSWKHKGFSRPHAVQACAELHDIMDENEIDVPRMLQEEILDDFLSRRYDDLTEEDFYELILHLYQKTDVCYIMNDKLDAMTNHEDICGLECTIHLMHLAIMNQYNITQNTCFRAMSAQLAENLKVGDSLVSRRFLSSTRYLPVALHFLETRDPKTSITNLNYTYTGILMVIQSRQGRAEAVHECNGVRCGEAEVIFSPNTVLQVCAIFTGTDASDYIRQFEAVKKNGANN